MARRSTRPSAPAAKVPYAVNERHFLEIDAVMLFVEEARRRTERAVDALRRDDAEPHLVQALEAAQEELSDLARRLRQGTFFAVPDPQLTL